MHESFAEREKALKNDEDISHNISLTWAEWSLMSEGLRQIIVDAYDQLLKARFKSDSEAIKWYEKHIKWLEEVQKKWSKQSDIYRMEQHEND